MILYTVTIPFPSDRISGGSGHFKLDGKRARKVARRAVKSKGFAGGQARFFDLSISEKAKLSSLSILLAFASRLPLQTSAVACLPPNRPVLVALILQG